MKKHSRSALGTSPLLSIFLTKRMMSVFLLGISSGLPLLLIGSTMKAWLKESGFDLTVIGVFGLVGLPYTLKFLWAPIFDRFTLPILDRRRGWIVCFQVTLAVTFFGMGLYDPRTNPTVVATLALIIAVLSASQDIVIDAYRREVLKDEELGLGSSLAVNGYRIGMLLAGAFALPLADQYGWGLTYRTMAGILVLLIMATLFSPSVDYLNIQRPRSWRETLVDPFIDYFNRSGSIQILAFILLYKVGDQMASDMLTPFYLDIGFSKTQIGIVSKFFGFWAVIIGGLLGGILILRWGIPRSLWVFGFLQAASTAGFSLLAKTPHLSLLASVVAFENLASGMGTAAYTGLMASLCNKKFTATQYALLSSLMGVPRVVFGASSGYLAKELGWMNYFLLCTALAIPGLLLLKRMLRQPTPTS